MLLKSVAVIVLFASCGIQYTTAQSSSSIDAFLRAVHKLDKESSKKPIPSAGAGKSGGVGGGTEGGKGGTVGDKGDTNTTKSKGPTNFVKECGLDTDLIKKLHEKYPSALNEDDVTFNQIQEFIVDTLGERLKIDKDLFKFIKERFSVKSLVEIEGATRDEEVGKLNLATVFIFLRNQLRPDIKFTEFENELPGVLPEIYEADCPHEYARKAADIEFLKIETNRLKTSEQLVKLNGGSRDKMLKESFICNVLQKSIDDALKKLPKEKKKHGEKVCDRMLKDEFSITSELLRKQITCGDLDDTVEVEKHVRDQLVKVIKTAYEAKNCKVADKFPNELYGFELGQIADEVSQSPSENWNLYLVYISFCKYFKGFLDFDTFSKDLSNVMNGFYKTACKDDPSYDEELANLGPADDIPLLEIIKKWNLEQWNLKPPGQCPIPLDEVTCEAVTKTIEHYRAEKKKAEAP
jgi:hypothetical protein